MTSTPPPKNEHPRRRRRFQFGLGALMLAVLLYSILAAALAGLIRPDASQPGIVQPLFILMAVAAPVGLMILISLWKSVQKVLRDRRGRK
ncbi:MAG: hypothetical protein ACYC35_26120 [Pirellulales bacterium]